LEALFVYVNAGGSQEAAAWFNGLEAAIQTLEINPERGTWNSKSKRRRRLLYGTKPNFYRIVYSTNIRKRLVTILYIRHGAMRPVGG